MEHHTLFYVCIWMLLSFNGFWCSPANHELTVNMTEGCLSVEVGNRIRGGEKSKLSLDLLVAGHTGLLYNAGSATAGSKAYMTKGLHLLTWNHRISDRTHGLEVLVDGRRVKFVKPEKKMWHTSYDFGQIRILKTGPITLDHCVFSEKLKGKTTKDESAETTTMEPKESNKKKDNTKILPKITSMPTTTTSTTSSTTTPTTTSTTTTTTTTTTMPITTTTKKHVPKPKDPMPDKEVTTQPENQKNNPPVNKDNTKPKIKDKFPTKVKDDTPTNTQDDTPLSMKDDSTPKSKEKMPSNKNNKKENTETKKENMEPKNKVKKETKTKVEVQEKQKKDNNLIKENMEVSILESKENEEKGGIVTFLGSTTGLVSLAILAVLLLGVVVTGIICVRRGRRSEEIPLQQGRMHQASSGQKTTYSPVAINAPDNRFD